MNLCKDCKHYMPDTEVQGVKSAACAITAQCPVSGSPQEPDSCWQLRHRGACGLSGALFEPAKKTKAVPKAAPKEVVKESPQEPEEEPANVEGE